MKLLLLFSVLCASALATYTTELFPIGICNWTYPLGNTCNSPGRNVRVFDVYFTNFADGYGSQQQKVYVKTSLTISASVNVSVSVTTTCADTLIQPNATYRVRAFIFSPYNA